MEEEDELLNLPEDTALAASPLETAPAELGDEDDPSNLPEDTAFNSMLVQEADAIGMFTPAPVQNVGQYVPEDFAKYKQDYNITLPGQLDDLSDYRGATQTDIDKYANGSVKFAGKTGVNVIGSIIGLGYGLYSGVRDEKWSSFYNNEFARGLDDLNSAMDETLPNHYTQFEREKGLWDQMGTANFWSDKFLNGMSFLAGAVITELGLSALTAATLGGAAGVQAAGTASLLARGTRLFKATTLGRKTTDVAKAASQFVSRQQLLDTGKLVRQLGTGAMYEAGVESRHAYDRIKDNLIIAALQEKGLDPYNMTKEQKFEALSVKERQDIEDEATSLSNGVFAGNVALVGMSNILMVPKLYGLGKHNLIRNIPGVQSLDNGIARVGTRARKLVEGKIGKTATDVAKGVGYVAGRGFYEGVIEEGGQGVMQRAAADYALLSGIRDDNSLRELVGASVSSFKEAGAESYFTDEGLTEVVLGAIMGSLGLPGVNTTAIQAYKNTKVRREALDYLDKAIEENPGLLKTLSTNAAFFMNVAKRSKLMDQAMEAGDMALAKDLEYDNFFDYVMAKIHTGQYQDIENQTDEILNMSEEEFIEWGGYTAENLTSEEVTKRKSHVVNAVKERAKQVYENVNKVDSNLRYTEQEKYVGYDRPGTKAFNRKMLIHALSTMNNTEEREGSIIEKLAPLIGGTLAKAPGYRISDKEGKTTTEDLTDIETMPVIEYQDAEGNIRQIDIAAFTGEADVRGQLVTVLNTIDALEKITDRSPAQAATLRTLYDAKVELNAIIKEVGDENILSQEEYEKIIEPWKKSDPEGFAKNEKEVYGLLADLRKLRARRQSAGEMYKKLMDPYYNPQVTQNIIDKINALDTEVTEEEKKARKRKDEEDARKVQEFKDKLQEARKTSEREVVNLEKRILDLKQEIKDLLADLVQDVEKLEAGKRIRGKNGRFLTVKDANKKIADIEETIRIGESLLKDLNVDRDNLYNILSVIDEFEVNQPNLNTYSLEMYGKTEGLLKEIDSKKSISNDLTLRFLRDMVKLKEEKQSQVGIIEKSIQEITDELVQLNDYKSILEDLLNQHRANFKKKNKLTLEEQDNVEFLASEIILTEQSINRLKELLPVDINSLDGIAPFVETLKQFQDASTNLVAFTLIQNTKIKKGTDADPNRPSANYTFPVEDAYNLELDTAPLAKSDISYPGFNRTTGRHVTDENKDVYDGALQTYRNLVVIDEDDRTDEEQEKFLIAESQLRWFNWLHTTDVGPTLSKGKTYYNYSLAAVTRDNIPEDLQKLGLTKDMFFDENDIKLVAVKIQAWNAKKKRYENVHKFVTDDENNPVFTSAMTSKLKRANGDERFRSDKDLKQSEKDDISEAHETWRKETLESDEVYLYNITGKSNGKIVLEDEATQNSGKLHSKNQYSDVGLYIGTSKTIDETITLKDIPMPVRTRSGLVWAFDKKRQLAIPMIGREFEANEVENVLRLLQKLITVRKESYDAQEGTKSWEKAYEAAKEFEFEFEGEKISLKKALDDIIYMRGKKSKKDDPRFQLIHRKGTFIFGDQSQEIGLENFEAGVEDEVYNSFKKFLTTKYHNISKSSITNGKKEGYLQVILNDDLTLDEDNSKTWKNYNEYLLKDRDEGQSPLLTRATPISSNSDSEILDAPRWHGGYAMFNNSKKQRKSLKYVRSFRGKAVQRATRTGRVIRDTVNETLEKAGVTRPSTNPNESPELSPTGAPITELTDLDPNKKPEEKPTYEPPADLKYVDMAINRMSGEELIEILEDPDEPQALKERIQDRYMDGDLSKEQSQVFEEKYKEDDTEPDTTTTPTTTKRPSTDQEDLPFLTSSYTLPSDKYIQETFGEELARLQGMLITEVIPVLGMISGMSGEGYAQLKDFGKILVSDLAPGGALYHEGFHNVSLHMLSPRDRQKLYNIVRRTKGKAVPYQELAKGEQDRSYKPVSKLLSEFTDKEAEEWLAEEFRRYVLSKGKYVIGQDTVTPEQRTIFQKLFDFIRDTFRTVFKLDKAFEIDPTIKGIEGLFAKIEEGGFKNAQRNLENKNVGSPMMAATQILNGQSAVFTADLNSTLTSYLAEAIQNVTYEVEEGREVNLEFADFLDMTPVKSSALAQAYRDAWALMYDDYAERLSELKEGTAAYNQVLKANQALYSSALGSKEIQGRIWDLGTENRYDATMIHQQFMKQLGLDLELEDTRDEDEVSSKMFQDIADQLEMSPTDTAKGVIKIILGTIPNRTGERNSTGLRGAYELKSVLKTLQTKLQGKLNFQDQLDTLIDLEEEYPWAKDVLERLGEDPYVMPTSFQEALLQTAFRNQFAKTMYDTQYTILQETGKIYNIDPNLERNLRGIRARWNASLRGKTRTSKHVQFDERGNIVFDKDVKSKFGNRKLTIKGVLNAVENSRDYGYKLDALEHLGIVFSNREKLEGILQIDSRNEMMLPGTDTTYRNAIDNGIDFVFGDIIAGTTSLTALFDRSESLSVTRMNHLAKLELDTTNIEYEFQHQNPEGKLVYSISMNNEMSTIANTPIDELKDYFPTKENPNKNPYAFNSLTLKALRDDPNVKMDVMIREGLAIEGAGQVGVKTSKLRPTDNLTSYIESIMEGVMPVLKAADIATDFSIRFPIKEFKDIRSAKDALLGYLVDEIVATNTATEEQINVKDYTDRINKLRMFKKLMSKLNPDMTSHLNNMMNNAEATRDDIQEFITLNSNAFFESIEKVLKEDVEELIEFMDKLKVVSKNEDDSYQLYGLNRARFGETLPDNVSKEKLQEFVETVVVRQTIYKNEMFKMFFGDPAFYKALFKRVKGAVGVKDIFNVDEGLNEWLNASENSRVKNNKTDAEFTLFDGKVADGFEQLVVVKEPSRITPFLQEYIDSLSPKVAAAYAKAAEKADGTLLLTLPAYREMAIRGNTWSPAQEKVYENVMYRGDTITDEVMGKFPPLKFQYFGYLANDNINTQVPGFFKMSAAPIYPGLGKMGNKTFTGIENMYKFLTSETLGGLILPSAFKIGVPGEDSQLELMEDGVILNSDMLKNNLDSSNVVNIDYRFMGTQLEVPSKFKGTSPIATQARVQVLSDLFQNGAIRPEFEALSPTIERYNSVLNSLTEQAYTKLLDEFGIKEKGRNEDNTMNYEVINNDFSKFIAAIKNESLRRQMPKQLLASLDYLEERNEEKKPVYFDAVSNKGRLEGVLWSLAGKRVIRQRFKGDMYVQQSSLGFETSKIDGIPGVRLDELEAYTEGDKYMQVYLPHHFKEMVGKDMIIKKDGIYDGDTKVGELDLLELIGIRIPTDGIHSIEAIKVKGFLPRTAGPTVVIPSEMVTKSGSDFDIDKLVLYFPAYRMRGGKLVKEKFYDSLEEWYNAEQRILNRNMKALEEMEDIMDSVAERDQLVKMLTDSFVSKIFGEKTADELFKESAEDISNEQADKLAQYFDSNPKEIRKSYARIKKIIAKQEVFSKSFEEWQAENPKATKYNSQSKGAMQNAVMEDMITLLQINNEERYDTWLQPVHTNDLEAIALELNGGVDPNTNELVEGIYKGDKRLPDLATITDYHTDTSIPNLIEVAEAFNKGKVLVGIAALGSTHHIKGQIAGLTLDTDNELKLPTGAIKEIAINFTGFDPLAMEHSLGRVTNVEGTMRISDAISQFTNASVDVVNNPILHILNITPDNANMWMFLTRVGVDIRTQAMFANQPIVKDYLQMLEIGRSRTSKVMEESIYDEEISKDLRTLYATNFKTSPTESDTYLLSADMLKPMVAKDVEDMTEEEKYVQLQVLSDMFMYSKLGETLGNIVTAQAFDTKIPKSRNHLRVILDMYKSALSTGLFKNAEKITSINTTQPATEVTEGVSEVFESNPELAEIGTEEQYNAYLNTIFPESKVKDIVYHNTKEKFEEFDKTKLISDGFYFTSDKAAYAHVGEVKMAVVLNLKNPITDAPGLSETINKPGDTKRFSDLGNDGIIDTEGLGEIIAFEPDQIHILGSKQDIIGFEDFIAKKGTPDTFMRSLSMYNYDMQTIFNDLFLTEDQQAAFMVDFKRIQKIYTNPNIRGLSVDERAKILNKYENGFISFIMQNIPVYREDSNQEIDLGDNIESLMLGEDSMAMQIETIQNPKVKHPLKDNPFIQNLIPVISPVREGKDMTNDYLQPLNRTMTPFEMNSIYDGFREVEATYPDIARNIIKTALLQTGIETARNSFLNTIPGDSIMRLMEDPLDRYATGNAGMVFNGRIEDYFEYFLENNRNDRTIAVKNNTYSKKTHPITYQLTSKSKKAFKQAIAQGAARPKAEVVYFRNPVEGEEGVSVPIDVRGSTNLVNMTNTIFLDSNYTIANKNKAQSKPKKGKKDPLTCKK